MHRTLSKLRGFTLIELMITVAVVAILASIALPSYLEQVRKSKRAEGKSALMRAAQNMERYYTNNNTYNATLAAAGIPAYAGDSAAGSPYAITLVGTATGFTLTATPASGFADPKCNVLTISNTGQKTESGSGTLADCW